MKHRVSYGACHCGGPQTIARLGANLFGDDGTPHSVRKDTKPSAKLCLLMRSTFVLGGISCLLDKPPFEPSLSNNVWPLTTAGGRRSLVMRGLSVILTLQPKFRNRVRSYYVDL